MGERNGSAGRTFCAAVISGALLLCASVEAGPFVYSADEKWRMEETMTVKMPGPSSDESRYQVSRMVMDYSVMKLFPGGAALVKKECAKSYAGPSVDALKEVATQEVPPVGHLLLSANGEVYLVQSKPVFNSPEEEEMAAGFDFPDELGDLEKSETADGFLAEGREPMDRYKISLAGTPVGRGAASAGFQVTRLKDEELGSELCEVHEAKRGVVSETVWFNRRAGKVLQRRIIQGNPASVEILQVRR